MSSDSLGDRMKAYERLETGQRFLPLLPIYARIDGRGFSRFTQGFDMPYDARFREAMLDTTRWLVEQTQARVGYTQSDEISLCWLAERYDSSIFFEGKKQKMVSQLAALATQRFNRFLLTHSDPFLRKAAERAPTFDALVFQSPQQGRMRQCLLVAGKRCNQECPVDGRKEPVRPQGPARQAGKRATRPAVCQGRELQRLSGQFQTRHLRPEKNFRARDR